MQGYEWRCGTAVPKTQVTVLIGFSDVKQQMLLSLAFSDKLIASHTTKQRCWLVQMEDLLLSQMH